MNELITEALSKAAGSIAATTLRVGNAMATCIGCSTRAAVKALMRICLASTLPCTPQRTMDVCWA